MPVRKLPITAATAAVAALLMPLGSAAAVHRPSQVATMSRDQVTSGARHPCFRVQTDWLAADSGPLPICPDSQ